LVTIARDNSAADWRWVEAAVTSYSPFALKDGPDAPTAVILRGLTARGGTPVALLVGMLVLAVGWSWAARRRHDR
jgi:hypothetical protein